MAKIIDDKEKEKYIKLFSGHSLCGKKEKALKYALDIRKFEIELYWKRTSYFWALIAATFTGYFAIASSEKANSGLLFLISCIGFILSLAWYLVNRGSKFWQQNWERHVDLLEDDIIGPLYKTIAISKSNFGWWKFWSAYPYSVSKINQLVSLYITVIWCGLLIESFPYKKSIFEILKISLKDPYWFLLIITILFTFVLLFIGRTSNDHSKRQIDSKEN